MERVLRNRRAAQSSRERKRQEVEALEQRNKELEARVLSIEKTNLLLLEELNKYRRTTGVVTRSSSTLDALPSNPVTLTSELFGSQGSHKTLIDRIIFAETSNSTVDPSSLSPKAATQTVDQLSPDPETSRAAAVTDERMSMTQTKTPSTELTQRPAAMLCDLQCQQSVNPQSWTASQMSPVQLQTQFLILSTLVSTCQRPLTQIAMSLKAGFSLPPTPLILKTIIWLVTRPRSSRPTRSTCHSSSMRTVLEMSRTQRVQATQSQRKPNSVFTSPTLRLTSLRKILTCSPILARPLKDATMEALRLVSESCNDQVDGFSTSNSISRDGMSVPPLLPEHFPTPSRETLITLLWALKVEERRIKSHAPPTERNSKKSPIPPSVTGLLVRSKKRPCDVNIAVSSEKRRCLR